MIYHLPETKLESMDESTPNLFNMKQLPNRRPIIRRKHRPPTSSFDSDPEEDIYDRRDSKKSKPDIKNPRKEKTASEVKDTEEIMVKGKVVKSQNQYESLGGKRFNKGVLEDCDHNIGNEIRKAKGAPEGGECSLEHVIMEDDSEEFDFTDWVEEQKKKIRETEKS